MGKNLNLLDKAKDIQKALDAEAYLSALALALSLPDVMAQVEYPELIGKGKVRARYVKWMNEFFIPEEQSTPKPTSEASEQLLNLEHDMDGEFYFALRNAILHSGNNDMGECAAPLDFKLSLSDSSVISVVGKDGGPYFRSAILSVPDFCYKMAASAEWTYDYYSTKPDCKQRLEDSEIRIVNFEE